MKKLFLLTTVCFIVLFGFGQKSPEPLVDSGYYYGIVKDTIMNKYIFMSFLSDDEEDNILYVVPYIMNAKEDTLFMHEHFVKSLENCRNDLVDGNFLVDNNWTISGFDNYPYYEIVEDELSFSLNIANIDSAFLDIFKFNGKITNDNKSIESEISSTNNIFTNSILILNYQEIQ